MCGADQEWIIKGVCVSVIHCTYVFATILLIHGIYNHLKFESHSKTFNVGIFLDTDLLPKITAHFYGVRMC